MTPDRIAILDWSAANRPRRGVDSIWLGLDDGTCWNPPTRVQAYDLMAGLIGDTLARGQTLMIGADFAFGYPAGFARALTGQPGALAVWDWLARHIEDDSQNRSNRIAVAAAINARLPGLGPFWFNPTRQSHETLPHRGSLRHGNPFAEHRRADASARGAQSPWKLGGAGAVGSQVLTGLPVLQRLRRAFPGQIAVWPFEPLTAPVILAEVFPSLLADEVRARLGPGRIKDQIQVTLLARALGSLRSLAPLLDIPADARLADEGWILGLGHEEALRTALA